VNTWQSCKKERECLVHCLRLLAVCWPCAQSDSRTNAYNQIPEISLQNYNKFTLISCRSRTGRLLLATLLNVHRFMSVKFAMKMRMDVKAVCVIVLPQLMK